METEARNLGQFARISKRIVQRLLTIGENRAELLLVELQEERERILLAILMALGIATFGLLTGVALTVIIAIAFWDHSPIIALAVLTACYVGAAIFLYSRLVHLKKEWQTLPATLDQLRKDIKCLDQTLS